MNKAGGYISLHRQILDWGWFKNANTLQLFIYLLLAANFTDGVFEGQVIKRGQIATSLPALAKNTGLSVKEVRTALKHLIGTGEVADSSSNRFRVITIVKYDEYQRRADKKAGKGQAKGRQRAGKGQQYNNGNNGNNGIINSKEFIAPTLDEIKNYINEKQFHVDPEYFFNYYEARDWELSSGKKMGKWKNVIVTWERREQNGRRQNQGTCGDAEKKTDSRWSDLRDRITYL